jgi:hypothetical protein
MWGGKWLGRWFGAWFGTEQAQPTPTTTTTTTTTTTPPPDEVYYLKANLFPDLRIATTLQESFYQPAWLSAEHETDQSLEDAYLIDAAGVLDSPQPEPTGDVWLSSSLTDDFFIVARLEAEVQLQASLSMDYTLQCDVLVPVE